MRFNKIASITIYPVILTLLATTASKGQRPLVKIELESQAIGTTQDVVPFWMRANQFGSIPLAGGSGVFIGRAYKDYQNRPQDSLKKRTFGWGFGLEGRANAGKESNFTLITSYVKLKAGMFQLLAGRTRDVTGLNGDTTLSSGNFTLSGNALGVPKIELSIPDYYAIPIFNELFSVKGNFVHGWLGKTRILDKVSVGGSNGNNNFTIDKNPSTYLHQKSLYVKFGMKNWRLHLFGGFNHQVFWGNEKAAYGPLFGLSAYETFTYVVQGKTYRPSNIPNSKIGNQIGSLDLGAAYRFNHINISIYRQSIYETGALYKLANIKDGLNGITLSNLKYANSNNDFKWKKILLELFYTKDQAGYPWSKRTQSGDEDYYNNYYYPNGWSYEGESLGNPLLTTKRYANTNLAAAPSKYFLNNRVIALHAGFIGSYKKTDLLLKATHSKNYGTFATSEYGESTGSNRNGARWGIFTPVRQLSLYGEAGQPLKNNYYVAVAVAFDQGELLPHSLGFMVKLKKSFR